MAAVKQAEIIMNRESKFWDKIADRYSKSPVADEESYQRKLQVTREYLRPDMKVLEFGCGTGSTAITHAPFVNHIQAIDISSKMIGIAQAKADANNVKNITFERSPIDEFSVSDQSFDAVLGLSILHLLHNKEGVISKVHRMLKPGGVFVSSTVCMGNTMSYFRIISPIGKFFGVLPLLRIFTSGELEHSLTHAGFEIGHQWQPGKGSSVFIVAKKAG